MSDEEFFECRYCEELIDENDMLKIPNRPKILSNWVNILGPAFQKNIKHNEMNMVCLRHFQESEWESRSTRNIRAKKPNVAEPSVQKYKNYLMTCRYCGQKCDPKSMSSVPRKPELLAKWFEILGPEFKKNCAKYRRSFICISHFNMPYGTKKRKPHILPVRMDSSDEMPTLEEEEDQSFSSDDNHNQDDEIPSLINYEASDKEYFQTDRYSKKTCAYCEKSKPEDEMTRVPRKADLVSKWAKILGAKFRENVKSRSNYSSFICLSHFDLPKNRKNRKIDDLPVRMEIKEEEEETEELLKKEKSSKLKHKRLDPPVKTKSIKIGTSEPTQKEIISKQLKKKDLPFKMRLRKLRKKPRYKEDEEEEDEEEEEEEVTVPKMERKRKELPIKMTLRKVKKKPRYQEEEEEEEVTVSNLKHKKSEPPAKMSLKKDKKEPKEEEEEDVPNLEHEKNELPSKMCLRKVRKQPRYEEETEEEEEDSEVIVPKLKRKRDKLPVEISPEKVKKEPKEEEEDITVHDLESESNQSPAKMCRRKVRNESRCEEKEEKEADAELKVSKSEYKRTRECAYCGEKKEQDEVTKVAKNEKIREKWFEILGRRFEKRVKSQSTSHICLSHFDLTDGVRRKHDLPKNMKELNTKIKNGKKRSKKLLLASPPSKELTSHQIYLSNLSYFGYIHDSRTNLIRQIKKETFFEESCIRSSFFSGEDLFLF